MSGDEVGWGGGGGRGEKHQHENLNSEEIIAEPIMITANRLACATQRQVATTPLRPPE